MTAFNAILAVLIVCGGLLVVALLLAKFSDWRVAHPSRSRIVFAALVVMTSAVYQAELRLGNVVNRHIQAHSARTLQVDHKSHLPDSECN